MASGNVEVGHKNHAIRPKLSSEMKWIDAGIGKKESQEVERIWLWLTVNTEITKIYKGYIIRKNASE